MLRSTSGRCEAAIALDIRSPSPAARSADGVTAVSGDGCVQLQGDGTALSAAASTVLVTGGGVVHPAAWAGRGNGAAGCGESALEGVAAV
eukprot:scaffold18728_cov121-Isochrysis_galbana.AAC.9